MKFIKAIAALTTAATLAACGAGGSSGAGATSVVPSTANGRGMIKVTLSIPPQKSQSARTIAYLEEQQTRKGLKRRDYVSSATTELDFKLNMSNGLAATAADQQTFDFTVYTSNASECTGGGGSGYSCTVTAPAPAGPDTYEIQAAECSASGTGPTASCSSLGGTLTTLSQAYVNVTVPLNQTVVAAFTLNPTVASIDWAAVTYANIAGPTPLASGLWLLQPNGAATPAYNASANSYSCTANAGSGSGNGCYEPAAKGTAIAYGEVLEARDATGALIVGASGGTVFQTPLYLTATGSAITMSWSCTDATGGSALTWETGGGPFTLSSSATAANESFNSPIAYPASDPDGGNTVDGNGNPVTAVGNNGTEINWDGSNQPLLDSPDSCTATTSNGLSTAANFYVGLGAGGVKFEGGATHRITM